MQDIDKQALLVVARESIKTYFSEDEPDVSDVKHLDEKQGVFVTLTKLGELRGCIGFPQAVMPLYNAVIEAARSAAFDDSRFPVVTKDELSNIKIEISVLSVPELIQVEKAEDYMKEIKIGEDGLILRSIYGSGLLLPQVATEHHMTISQFLNALSQKAGLSFDAWKDLKNQIFKFQAEVFSEK
ncbi:MAG: AmmeMemoRadiSam system protein A [archaeon]